MARRTHIISDTHFFHKKVIDYENRPFPNVHVMNEELIRRWNSVVRKDDQIIHLGDVSFGKAEETREIIKRLNGYKRLIMGNHDRDRSRKWWVDAGFDEVSEEPILFKEFFILSHEPIYLNANMPYANVHGHIHNLKYEGSHHINACVEHWDYTPFLFDRVLEIAKEIIQEEEA